MTVTCQRCGKEVAETIATQFHSGWCIDCINDLMVAEQEAVDIMIRMTREAYLQTLYPLSWEE